jgi:hypothetical protein
MKAESIGAALAPTAGAAVATRTIAPDISSSKCFTSNFSDKELRHSKSGSSLRWRLTREPAWESLLWVLDPESSILSLLGQLSLPQAASPECIFPRLFL